MSPVWRVCAPVCADAPAASPIPPVGAKGAKGVAGDPVRTRTRWSWSLVFKSRRGTCLWKLLGARPSPPLCPQKLKEAE